MVGFVQEPQRCLDLCEKIARQYHGVDILFKQFNAIYFIPGRNVSPTLKEMEGFVNVFKYTDSVCALIFDLEDENETEDHHRFITSIIIGMRKRIASV